MMVDHEMDIFFKPFSSHQPSPPSHNLPSSISQSTISPDREEMEGPSCVCCVFGCNILKHGKVRNDDGMVDG